MQKLYKVIYEVDVLADDPEEAAHSGYDQMVTPDGHLPILTVTNAETGESTDIDLEAEDGED